MYKKSKNDNWKPCFFYYFNNYRPPIGYLPMSKLKLKKKTKKLKEEAYLESQIIQYQIWFIAHSYTAHVNVLMSTQIMTFIYIQYAYISQPKIKNNRYQKKKRDNQTTCPSHPCAPLIMTGVKISVGDEIPSQTIFNIYRERKHGKIPSTCLGWLTEWGNLCRRVPSSTKILPLPRSLSSRT